MEKMELLSPAGSFSALKQAVFNGADAVYLGIKQFNARNNIEGFNLESLKEAVNFAHLYNVKVYLAINILFKDEELFNAANLIVQSNNVGVDAFIVQDIGLANIIHKTYPNIKLHASTQLAIHNLEGALEAEKIGFTRVVLARETTLSEIKRIKQYSKIELEFFAHGALCVSFSGNCYMCSHLKNKSGNRGECLQFCRLKYDLFDGSDILNSGYLLSAKDICMINYIKQLKDAGIDCLKIEGRARRDFYVAVATNIYSKVMNNDTLSQSDMFNLKLAFNREFTPAYLNGNQNIISQIQGHNGEFIGSVKRVNLGKKFNEIFIDTKYQLHPKSTLKFVNNGKEIASINAVDIKKQNNLLKITTTNNNILKGSEVRILSDANLEEELLKTNKKHPILVEISSINNKMLLVNIGVNDTKYQYEYNVLQLAKNQPVGKLDFINSFNKSNIFNPQITVNVGNVFVAKSIINEVRRDIYSKLEEQLCENYLIENNLQKVNPIKKLPTIKKAVKQKISISTFDTLSQTSLGNLDKSDIFVYDPEIYAFNEIENLQNHLPNKKFYLNLPNFATAEDLKELQTIVKKLKLGVVANNIYALEFDAPKIAGGFLNVYNSYTVNFFQEKGINIFYSKELTPKEIEAISHKTGAVVLQDKKHYMTLRHCPIKQFIGGNCSNCRYKEGLNYKMQDGAKFKITRKKVKTCTFYLEDV